MRLRSLPARPRVYFVLGCALLSAEPYAVEVIRKITAGLDSALAAAGWQVPASTALSRARARVGERPLESLFRRVCSALSPGRGGLVARRGLLVVAVDGTTISVPDSPANAAAFGLPGTGKKRRPAKDAQAGQAADGQERPGRCGGPAAAAGDAAGVRDPGAAGRGHRPGARQGDRRAGPGPGPAAACPGMLLLADRRFYGYGQE